MKILKLIVIGLIGVAIIFLVPQLIKSSKTGSELQTKKFDDWHEFKEPQDKFNVKMPGRPQHAKEKHIDKKTEQVRQIDMYATESPNGTIYLISLINFQVNSEVSDPEKLLQNTVDDMVAANAQNKLVSEKKTTYKNNKAIEFEIENLSHIIDGKAFIYNSTLYVLTVVAVRPLHDQENSSYFINSFDLKNPEPLMVPFPPQP